MRIHAKRMFAALAVGIVVLFGAGAGWFYLTPSGTKVRLLMADTVLTTRHRDWAVWLLGRRGFERRMDAYRRQFDRMGETGIGGNQPPGQPVPSSTPTPSATGNTADSNRITYEKVEGKHFQGVLMYVSDPLAVRVGIPAAFGKGETVSSMVKRTGAAAGINGGGFFDPSMKGQGFLPLGVVVSQGKLLFNGVKDDQPTHIIGLDEHGTLIAGKYRPSELSKLGIREAVSYYPKFISEGKGLVENDEEGWGLAPRTAIAQKKDGTLILAVIDGRQKDSFGATLYDLQQLLLEKGAVTAANLDGGYSSVMVRDGEPTNQPALGERNVPTAWLVFQKRDSRAYMNVWDHLDPAQIEPTYWEKTAEGF